MFFYSEASNVPLRGMLPYIDTTQCWICDSFGLYSTRGEYSGLIYVLRRYRHRIVSTLGRRSSLLEMYSRLLI
jgi:hypothetical protein